MKHNTAFVFCVGRELLEGLVLDRNANFMAGKLTDSGCRVLGIQVVDNDLDSMVEALRRALAAKPRFILTTGGMGPGHDDITREAVATATGAALQSDERAMEFLEAAYRRLAAKGVVDDAEVNENRAVMASLPEGAVCFENPIGAAPAVRLVAGNTTLFMMPGVPQEMQRIFNLYVLPAIQAESQGSAKQARKIDYPGRDESALSRVLADLARRYPGVHSRARLREDGGHAGIRITLFGEHTDEQELSSMLDRAEADMRARLGLEMPSGPALSGEL